MNYFAHGQALVDMPFVMAGTAVPDWLSVVDRRVRARAKLAKPWIDDADPVLAGVARGVVLHHRDDAWFHQTRAFAELSMRFTLEVRQVLTEETEVRPGSKGHDFMGHGFLGHILVELLVDAALIEHDIKQLDRYYAAMESLDPMTVSAAVDQMTTRPAGRLAEMIGLFCRERFLYDYLDDAKLWARLNRVMRRVKLPELPPSMLAVLAGARQPVRQRLAELLDGPNAG